MNRVLDKKTLSHVFAAAVFLACLFIQYLYPDVVLVAEMGVKLTHE